jgi:hypothetical protein
VVVVAGGLAIAASLPVQTAPNQLTTALPGFAPDGSAAGPMILNLKGESAQIGAAINAVLGADANTEENRRSVGDYCEDCKRRGDRGTKNKKGDFTFSELVEKVKEYFGVQ